jgi:hypothetical protein
MMNFIFSKHAEEQMQRRNISRDTAIDTVLHPAQTLVDDEFPGMKVFQSLIKENEQIFLLRVFVNVKQHPNIIVTLYKTSKIKKYYESKI